MMAQRLDDESYDRLLPDDLSGIGREVVSRLMQKDRDLRYASAEDVLTAIQTGAHSASPSVDSITEPATYETLAPPAEDIVQEVDWASAWEVNQIQQQCHSGAYYRCIGRQTDIPNVVMYLPSSDSPHSETIISYADKLVEVDSSMVLSYAEAGYMDGERAYICRPYMGNGGKLLQLLQAEGNFALQTHLCIFQQLAKAIDEASEIGLPGLELNAAMILVDQAEMSEGSAPSSTDDWLAYFEGQISADNLYARNVRLTVLPKLEEPTDDDDIQATVTLEDLATDPLTKFGSLIYRSISGMSVRPAAYLRESGYVSTSNLGEESNRFLSEIIANRSDVSSATEIITMLCDFEGVSWEIESLETHAANRRSESELFVGQVTGVGQLLSDALAAEQRNAREREERERREAGERETKKIADEEARRKKEGEQRAAEAAAGVRRKEEDARKNLETKKREEKEAKAAAAAEKLRIKEEARKKKEDEAQAAADAEKSRLEEEKAAKLKKKQEQLDAKTRAAETKRQQEIREQGEELDRIAAEKEKLKQQEVQALAAAKTLKQAEDQEIKEKEKQARKSVEDEKKRRKQAQKLEDDEKRKQAALAKAETKKKEQAEKDRLKLEEEKRKAEEAKRKTEEEKGKLAEAKKESARLHKEALHAQKQAAQEKKKVEKERKQLSQLSQQQQGTTTGLGSKKKPIIIAAAALIIAILAFVGIKSFSGNDDDGGGGKPGTNTVSTNGNGNTNTKDPDGSTKIKPAPVPTATECVVIIPLSDDGEGVPDDVEFKLISGGQEYGSGKKNGKALSMTLNEGQPPLNKRFKLQIDKNDYVMEPEIILNSQLFVPAEAGTFAYKNSIKLDVRAQFEFSPSLPRSLVKYKKTLLEQLNTKEYSSVVDHSGEVLKKAKVSYDEKMGVIITMPSGWSFNGQQAKLIVEWPYIKLFTLNITKDGIEDREWPVALKLHDVELRELAKRMPKFQRVEFESDVESLDVDPSVHEVINALLKIDDRKYSLTHQDLLNSKSVMKVPCGLGDLLFFGGCISKDGMRYKDGVVNGKLISSFPAFPKKFYIGAIHTPVRNDKGRVVFSTMPGMLSIHLQDKVGESLPSSNNFLFNVMLGLDGKFHKFNTKLQVEGITAEGKWRLSSMEDSKANLNLLLLIKADSNGGLVVDYLDIMRNGGKSYTVDGKVESAFGLKIVSADKGRGIVNQQIVMKFNMHWDSVDVFNLDVKRVFAEFKPQFEALKASYDREDNYPGLELKDFQLLSGR